MAPVRTFTMRARAAGALAVLALLVGACAGDDDGARPLPTTAPTTAPTTPITPETPDPTTSPTAPGELIEVRDGAVVGGRRTIEAEVGEEVVITVSSDVADEVHVHGYDFTADVDAGGSATLRFTADIPGQFEIELENSGVLLAELVVGG